MAFIEPAYAFTAPLLLLFSLFGHLALKRYAKALLAATNLIFILYAVFLINQLIDLVKLGQELMKQSGIKPEELPPFEPDAYFFRLTAFIILPWFFLIRRVRNTPWLPIVLLLIIVAGGTGSWNYFNLTFKILHYASLLCAVYAFLWLLKELPFQRRTRKLFK
ncbi:hypothetical protein [Sediminibacterium goheungense]|uniref:Uncharacterized protein n=1 Tax=Sediminibacterium goheungense TaxID=1086393 RepID=A0A4R6J125_9BACT|nr:hypothetical protein [Sediminibacterium goheungense]TDO28527.1 hypothetical protein BC659_0593 [Sediminibacterium goheungense]